MKKSDMVTTIKAQYEAVYNDVIDWNNILNKDCKNMNKTFKEALKDGSAYDLISYRIWLEYSAKHDMLEQLMRSLNI